MRIMRRLAVLVLTVAGLAQDAAAQDRVRTEEIAVELGAEPR